MALICISWTSGAECLFIYLLTICVSSLKKCLFESFAHFLINLFLSLSYRNSCVLLILTLYQRNNLEILSPIPQATFSLMMVSFAVQRIFSLMQSYWSILVFVVCAFVISTKSLQRPVLGSFVCFLPGILDCVFQFLFHFELISVVFLQAVIQFAWHHLWSRTTFPTV